MHNRIIIKRIILVLIFISTQIHSFSQDFDLIVTITGDSIACHIDSISDSHYHFEMLSGYNWIHTTMSKSLISNYQPNAITQDSVTFKKGTSYILKNKAKIEIYKTWVTLINSPSAEEGVLYEIKDSSILVSSSVVLEDYYTRKFETINLHIDKIEMIKTRKKGTIGKGVWIGALSGFAVGAIIGVVANNGQVSVVGTPVSSGVSAFAVGIPSAAVGAGVGALVGSFKVRIPINGDMNNYMMQKKKLKKYSFK